MAVRDRCHIKLAIFIAEVSQSSKVLTLLTFDVHRKAFL